MTQSPASGNVPYGPSPLMLSRVMGQLRQDPSAAPHIPADLICEDIELVNFRRHVFPIPNTGLELLLTPDYDFGVVFWAVKPLGE